MTTAPKTVGKAAAKTVTKPAAKTAAKVAAKPAATSEQPSLRFFHSKELRVKTQRVLDALEAKPEDPKHASAVADLVGELVQAGMDYYFLRALKQADVGFLTEQSARLGLSGAVTLISSVSRKFIVRMDPPQLLMVASHVRELAA